jgi:hypothetical protein
MKTKEQEKDQDPTLLRMKLMMMQPKRKYDPKVDAVLLLAVVLTVLTYGRSINPICSTLKVSI